MSTTNHWADPAGAYAILALLALGALGATLSPGGWRDRSRRVRRLIAAAVLVGAALSLLWPQIAARRRAERTSVTLGSSQVAGVWAEGLDTLRLHSDGTYSCLGVKCVGLGSRGRWELREHGGLLVHWSDGHTVPWYIVLYHDRYRLSLAPVREQGASWDGQLLYERIGQ